MNERYVADMSHAVPIEPHAVVAQWQGDKVTVWSSTQVPFIARSGVATTLEMPESHVRIIVPHLGGGFGGKCEFHFEAHVAALARAAERPVRLRLQPRARSSSRPTTAARVGRSSSRPASCRTARSSPAAAGWCWTAAPTAPTTRSSRSSPR